jgi:chromosome segregation ATPase
MRQGKLSELIHSSEAGREDYCKVEVWFKEIKDLVRHSPTAAEII